jgi:hypothetical protein
MKDGASGTIHKQNNSLLNGNRYHHVDVKAFESIRQSKQIAHKEMYISILRCLRDAVRKKRPEKWRTNSWFLLDDNAPAHRSVLVKDELARNDVTILEHFPYRPWLQLNVACSFD